jgi:uncharacterized membrane protein YphA (DoxX/SURF4 family)
MFPGGWPGIALVLLRVCATATPIISACQPIHDRPGWYLWALFALGAAICAGFLTHLAAFLSAAFQLFAFNTATASPLWQGASLLNALCLALIGPGAYSLDALRFGRRLLMSNRRR